MSHSTEGPFVRDLPSTFKDPRGIIRPIFHDHKGSVVIIESNKDAQRANHYHKEDYHYCYVISGSIIYYERKANCLEMPEKYIVRKDEMIFTPPMVEHCMYFTEPTVFLTVGGKTRKQKEYEEDLIRVDSLHDIYLANSDLNKPQS